MPSEDKADGDEGPRLVFGRDSSEARPGERIGFEADLGVVYGEGDASGARRKGAKCSSSSDFDREVSEERQREDCAELTSSMRRSKSNRASSWRSITSISSSEKWTAYFCQCLF